MKLTLIYDPKCPKLVEGTYSRTYLDMLEALIVRFDEIRYVTDSCSAKDIEADVILVYDIHSAHHIEIDGLANHKAVKYTYFNDPYQTGVEGVYTESNIYVCKLGAKQRTQRALRRGIDYIICPYRNLYYQHIGPHLNGQAERMLFWFPPAPAIHRFAARMRRLAERKHKILANGLTHGGMGAYDFRAWAYSQAESYYMKHAAYRPDVPRGAGYGDLLSAFAGSLALCDTRIVPKYLEIPLAGCVCFAQEQDDYKMMGFKDGKNCFFVTRENFKDVTAAFLNAKPDEPCYQAIADSGRKLIERNWTAKCFADALYEHAHNQIHPYQTQGVQT